MFKLHVIKTFQCAIWFSSKHIYYKLNADECQLFEDTRNALWN